MSILIVRIYFKISQGVDVSQMTEWEAPDSSSLH